MTEILLKRQVAAEYPIPAATLQFYRSRGGGPKSFKLGGRVVYKRSDVEAWIEERYNAENGGGPSNAA
jgi:predicted DNA-binding transcriptional regulator AlpA